MPANRSAFRCRSAAEWVSVSRVWWVCSRGTYVTCARAPNTNQEAGYRPASPQHPAIAYSTFRLYWLVTYGAVGYASVGKRREAEQWQLPTYRHSRI